jgi:hypothetical protein
MLRNGTEEAVKEFEKGCAHLASDSYYLGDLNDEGLIHLYELLQSEYKTLEDKKKDKKVEPSYSDQPSYSTHGANEFLRAEVNLRSEFHNRSLPLPGEGELSNYFLETVVKPFTKASKKDGKHDAVTPPDASDEHTHIIKGLDENGDGATEESGTPAHTHNVDNWMVLPVTVDKYKSDHPGKVLLKAEKTSLRVTKRLEDGSLEWEADFKIFKVNEDQQLVGGVVYEPDIVDAQGDSAPADEILKACHNYMIKSMTLGEMHEKKVKKGDSYIVENYIAPCNFIQDNQIVRKGSWVMIHKVVSKDLWKNIKDGKYTGFSMAGRAKDVSKSPLFGKNDNTPQNLTLKNFLNILKGGHDVEKVIRQVGDQYCVYDSKGKTKLGCHPTREEAFKQLAAIETNKHLTPKHLSETEIEKEIGAPKELSITYEQMKGICRRCSGLMKRGHIQKVRISTIINKNKFKRMFGIRRSTSGHDGLCRKFCSDPKLFITHVQKLQT